MIQPSTILIYKYFKVKATQKNIYGSSDVSDRWYSKAQRQECVLGDKGYWKPVTAKEVKSCSTSFGVWRFSYIFPQVSNFDILHEVGKLKFTAIEGRCLISAFQVQTICEASEIGKKGRQQIKLLTKSGHYIKHINILVLNFFKRKKRKILLNSWISQEQNNKYYNFCWI